MLMPNTPHTLHNPSIMSRFTAIVHGVAQGSGYGYPAGYNLRTLLCSPNRPDDRWVFPDQLSSSSFDIDAKILYTIIFTELIFLLSA